MNRIAKTLSFATWLEYENFLHCAYQPLPLPGDRVRIGLPTELFEAWLVCDEEGYVRSASCELAYQLEEGFQR